MEYTVACLLTVAVILVSVATPSWNTIIPDRTQNLPEDQADPNGEFYLFIYFGYLFIKTRRNWGFSYFWRRDLKRDIHDIVNFL